MKLVDILARELKEWPKPWKFVAQDSVYFDCQVAFYDERPSFSRGEWGVDGNPDFSYCYTEQDFDLSDDYATAIVTRAQWEAARAKLSKPKGGKDGFIRHRGGKCPVEAGTLVDVRFRSGIIKTVCDSLSFRWSHSGAMGDIMAYRIHTPSEQPATTKESLAVDPLAWRERIFEIDAESKAEEERHCQVMTALDSERAELVRKLASESLALIERKVEQVEDSKEVDTGKLFTGKDDPAYWIEGDQVEIVWSDNSSWLERKGLIGTVKKVPWDRYWFLDFGDKADQWCCAPSNCRFKWHSRPTN